MGAPSRWTCLAGIAVALACAEPALALDPPPATAPTITASTPSPGTMRSLSYEFTGELLNTFQCRLDGPSAVVEDWAACDSPKSYTLATSDPDGVYTFSVHALDPLLGQSADSTTTYTLDTTGPTVTIDSGPTGQISDEFVSFSFSSEAGAITSCRLTRDGATVYDWLDCPNPWAYGLSTQPDGNYAFEVRARDGLGNTGSAATQPFTLSRPRPAAQTGQSGPATTSGEPTAGETPLALRPGVCLNLFSGTPGADRISGSGFGDVLDGLAGNDRLDGLAGGDCVIGDAGNDVLRGGTGNDDVRGSAGNDTVYGGAGADTLSGSAGRDVLDGGPGDDRIDGNSGTDRIFGRSGKDTINAADGRRETVDCGTGRDSVTADRADKLVGCETKHLRSP